MELQMDSSAAQFHHHQEMSSQTLESMLVCNKAEQDKKPRPPDQAALNCPRCDSTNTKFCYYNNYSLTQPRYFCKSCRRYWTKGGTLRNVPVGGGCRKSNKRPSSSSSTSTSPTSSSSSKRVPHDLIHHNSFITKPSYNNILSHLPNYHHDTNTTTTDLSLAFARLQSQTSLGFDHDHNNFLGGNAQNTPHGSHDHILGGGHFLDVLRGEFLANGNSNSIFHNVYSSHGDQNQMGNAENGGILDLSSVNKDHDQVGLNNALYDQNGHQEEHQQMVGSGAAILSMVKQESCNGREVGGGMRSAEERVLWGYPWQIGGSDDHQGNVVHREVDPGRNWSGFGSTWHGLLNSPLM